MRDLPVKIDFVKALEANQYGPRSLVKFLDDAGNILTWFASGDRDFSAGAAAKITGTVKGHSDYQGIQETQISRVVVNIPETTP